jgi:hypothetical protein
MSRQQRLFQLEYHDDLRRLRLVGGEPAQVCVAPVGDVDDSSCLKLTTGSIPPEGRQREGSAAMALPADVVIAALRSGAGLRISGAGLAPSVIQGYASAAKDGGSHITIVIGDVTLMRHLIEGIGGAGRGHVTLDFADNP